MSEKESPVFLTPKDRAQVLRYARKRDRAVRDANAAVNAANNELAAFTDDLFEKYGLAYEPGEIDLTTGEIRMRVPTPPPQPPVQTVKAPSDGTPVSLDPVIREAMKSGRRLRDRPK